MREARARLAQSDISISRIHYSFTRLIAVADSVRSIPHAAYCNVVVSAEDDKTLPYEFSAALDQ